VLDAFRSGLRDVCNLVFPPVCPSCRGRTLGLYPLCRSCELLLSEFTGSLCYACDPHQVLSSKVADKAPCGVPGHEQFRVTSGLLMRGPAADLIHAFKYAGARGLARFLAACSLGSWRQLNASPPDFLTAVPLHRSRLRERGYNQSLLLAEALTRLTGVVTVPGLLERARPTKPQVSLPSDLRSANVEGAFVAPLPLTLEGKAVTLVDDVATTGATLRACAAALLGAGASRVTALVAAIS
jgi:ComF family protein